jgi:hypothetical protein
MDSARLWSLWDMLKDNAVSFVKLGERIADTTAVWWVMDEKDEDGEKRLNQEGRNLLRVRLDELSKLAARLNLTVADSMLATRLKGTDNLPQTEGEFLALIEVLKIELRKKVFLFVPDNRAPFWEKGDLLSERGREAFPNSAAELREAGNSYAAGLSTGAVFYSMRALEYGLRALADDVGLTFDVQNWQNIINEIESVIEGWRKNGIPGMKKADKDDRLNFLSGAAKEFAYFKDGWRNYVAHAKVPYGEHQALTVMSHVADFMDRLSERLKEPT